MARLPDFHDEVRGVFRVSQSRRANPGRERRAAGGLVFFHAQANAGPLGQRQRLDRPERSLGEDGIDLADHELIVPGIGR